MVVGRRWILRRPFDGLPKVEDFELVSEELGPLEDGEILYKERVDFIIFIFMEVVSCFPLC
jgi:hypothetical protein